MKGLGIELKENMDSKDIQEKLKNMDKDKLAEIVTSAVKPGAKVDQSMTNFLGAVGLRKSELEKLSKGGDFKMGDISKMLEKGMSSGSGPQESETCSWYKNSAMPSCMGYTQACKKRHEMEEDQFEKYMSSKTTIDLSTDPTGLMKAMAAVMAPFMKVPNVDKYVIDALKIKCKTMAPPIPAMCESLVDSLAPQFFAMMREADGSLADSVKEVGKNAAEAGKEAANAALSAGKKLLGKSRKRRFINFKKTVSGVTAGATGALKAGVTQIKTDIDTGVDEAKRAVE